MNLIPSSTVSRRLAVAYGIAVIAVSSYPGIEFPEVGSGNLDKLLHFAQYAVLGFLVSRGWGTAHIGGTSGFRPWIPALILLMFASVDEYHQHWIPGRFPEWADWIADILGISVGYTFGILANRQGRESKI